MLKKMSLRKIGITTCALVLLMLFYTFPNDNKESFKIEDINYEEDLIYKSVYLLDRYDYVSKIMVNVDSNETLNLAKEKIEFLIDNSNKSDSVPNGFKSLIPNNTKLIDLKLENDLVSIYFSKDILSVTEENEEKMIEAIVYSLTDIPEINKVNIYVEDEILDKLPNSNKKLDMPLTRKYGINKQYDIDNLNDTTKTTIFYLNDKTDNTYYTPVTFVNNDRQEKISIIVDELKSSVLYQSNLSSYLSAASELENYEIIENTMYLSFNDKLFDDINSTNILEEVKYTINASIKENYDVSEVVYLVDGKEIEKIELKTLE